MESIFVFPSENQSHFVIQFVLRVRASVLRIPGLASTDIENSGDLVDLEEEIALPFGLNKSKKFFCMSSEKSTLVRRKF
jgi:hypothetical protein